jgi:hypothetical protein
MIDPPSACFGIYRPRVLTAPVIGFHVTVLIIPFVDVSVPIAPSSAPSSCHSGFGPDPLCRRYANEPLRRWDRNRTKWPCGPLHLYPSLSFHLTN